MANSVQLCNWSPAMGAAIRNLRTETGRTTTLLRGNLLLLWNGYGYRSANRHDHEILFRILQLRARHLHRR